jgi:hypothetical protein
MTSPVVAPAIATLTGGAPAPAATVGPGVGDRKRDADRSTDDLAGRATRPGEVSI